MWGPDSESPVPEPNEIKRKLAEEWYGVKLLDEDIYKTSFKDMNLIVLF
jgi:hypothetical protein